MEEKKSTSFRILLFRPLMAVLGVLLVAAGLLKIRALVTGATPALDWVGPVQRELAVAEIVVGIWLLLGLAPIWTRRLAIALFFVLFNAAFLQYLWDLPSCSCMGAITVRPLYMALFDAAAVTLLVGAVPSPSAPNRFRGFRWAVVGASIVLGAFWTLSTAFQPRSLVATEGSPPASGDRYTGSVYCWYANGPDWPAMYDPSPCIDDNKIFPIALPGQSAAVVRTGCGTGQ